MAKKICEACGGEYEGASRSKLCDACRDYSCPICSRPIKLVGAKRAEFLRRGWVTCSSKCGHEMAVKRGVSFNSPGKKKTSFKKTCVVCGEEFDGAANAKLCQGCRTQQCIVCGKSVSLVGAKVSKFLERGWVTCGDPKCRAEITKRNLVDMYGVENVSQLDSAGEKIGDARLNESEETKAKRSASLKKSCSSPECNKKRRETNVEKYGFEYIFQIPDVHSKGIEAARTKKTREKVRRTVIDRYGVQNSFLVGWENRTGPSSVELAFGKMLEDAGIPYEIEFFVGGKPYDFKVGDTLIELNPWAWHNVTSHPFCKDGSLSCMKPYYHSQKTAIAASGGYRCIHVFDWDDVEKIIGMVTPVTKVVSARQCSLVRYNDFKNVNEYLNTYHLQGSSRGVSVAYTLEIDGEIVSCMTFGRPRYNKNFDWELLRYCPKSGVAVSGGAERLLSHFRKDFAGSIVSYRDVSKFDGGVYRRLGFVKEAKGTPTSHWYNPKTGRHITDSLLRQRGADQLLGTRDGKGTDNKEIMVREGFVEIYDCGQARYAIR